MRSLSQGKYTYKAREIKRKGDKQNPKQEMSWKKYMKNVAQNKLSFLYVLHCALV